MCYFYLGFPLMSSEEATRRTKFLFTLSGCNSLLSNADLLKCGQALEPAALFDAIYGVKLNFLC